MKTEYHLVLTSNKYTFKDWTYKFMETFGNIPPTNHYNHTKQQLKVFIGNDTYYYIGFTPQMSTQRLFGYRFKSIINEIGLTEKELAIFNYLWEGRLWELQHILTLNARVIYAGKIVQKKMPL